MTTKNTPDDRNLPRNFPGGLPPELESLIQSQLDLDKLHGKVHVQSMEWAVEQIEALYKKWQQPTHEWLKNLSDESGDYAAITPEIRMAAYCIAAEAYQYIFEKRVGKGLTPEEDYMISLFRAFILIGFQLKSDEDKFK